MVLWDGSVGCGCVCRGYSSCRCSNSRSCRETGDQHYTTVVQHRMTRMHDVTNLRHQRVQQSTRESNRVSLCPRSDGDVYPVMYIRLVWDVLASSRRFTISGVCSRDTAESTNHTVCTRLPNVMLSQSSGLDRYSEINYNTCMWI